MLPTLRRLAKNLSFSLPVILTLSLSIGATVSVFSIVYVVLIQPLPYGNPSRLVEVFESKTPNDEATTDHAAPGNFTDWQEQNRVFTGLAASCGFTYNLTGMGEPEHLNGFAISANYFSVLQVKPILGRDFLPQEDRFSAQHVAILSHDLWSGKFHSDPAIVGKSISLDGDPFYIVGIMPAGFVFPYDEHAQIWVPLRQQIRPDRMLVRNMTYLTVIGRLHSGASLDQARADMNRIAQLLRAQYPESTAGAVVMPLQETLVGEMRPTLLLSFAIVGCVLLIATANVAILMLARMSGRARELAVRLALGASSWSVVREVLDESVLLGLCSGVLGIVLALCGRKLLLHLAPQDEMFSCIGINWAVLVFAVAVSLIVGLGFGLLPAIGALRTDIQQVLRKAGNAATIDIEGRRFRHALIVGEISLSLVLLMGTGLLMKSMLRLEEQPLGFQPEHLVTAWVGLPRIHYQNNADVVTFFTRVQERLRGIAGAQSVGLGYRLPLGGSMASSFTIPGRQYVPGEHDEGHLHFIDSGLLTTLQMPLLDGRNIRDSDDANSEPVVIVSQSFARKYWPGESAVGKYVTTLRETPVTRRVIGVVGDARYWIEDEFEPTMYVSFKQLSFPSMSIVVRTADDVGSVAPQIRRAVQSVDPEQPVLRLSSMDSVVRSSLEPWRFALSLLGGLAAMALLLTVIGLFGVISYLVRERTKEMGVRMALGADRGRIMKLILGQSLRLIVSGLAIGFAIAFVIVRSARSMVYAIRPNDPSIFILVAVCLSVVALLGSYVPARRAAQIDPMRALREE
jgi:putative ABC transport system permease protein